jgi:3-dehydroquinate dehydratase-1
VVEETEVGMVRAALEAEGAGADLVELRLDWLPSPSEGSVERVFHRLEGLRIPKIATVMPSLVFGKYEGSGSDRMTLLMKAAEFAEYVDIGIEMDNALMRQCLEGMKDGKAELIVSWHSQRMLGAVEIQMFVNSMPRSTICKVVMPAQNDKDNLLALEVCASLEGQRRIVFCHGSLGVVSRVLCPLFGSEWAYASATKEREGAPGQLDVVTMRKLYEVLA